MDSDTPLTRRCKWALLLVMLTSGAACDRRQAGQLSVDNQWRQVLGTPEIHAQLVAANPRQPAGFILGASPPGTLLSTDNGGTTWAKALLPELGTTVIGDLVVSPHDPHLFFLAGGNGKIFQSPDAGKNWSTLIPAESSNGFHFATVPLVVSAPSAPQIIYAMRQGAGLFKSADRGIGWQFLAQAGVRTASALAVHPTDPLTVYLGEGGHAPDGASILRRSRDGGVSWETVLIVDKAGDIGAITVVPGQPDTVYLVTAGVRPQIWVSNTGGDTWTQMSRDFRFLTIHTLALHPSDSASIVVDTWGGGLFRTIDGGASWTALSHAPTRSASAILLSPHDARTIYLGDRLSPKLYRTGDDGKTWETVFDAGDEYYRVLTAAVSPSHPGVVYLSLFRKRGLPMAGDVFRIEDGKASVISQSLTRLAVSIAVDPRDEKTIYLVQHGSGLVKSSDAGKSWTKLSTQEKGIPSYIPFGFFGVVVDRQSPDTVYLFGGSDVIDNSLRPSGADPEVMHTVYKSVDGGSSWRNLNDGNLGQKSGPVKSLAVSPVDGNRLFIATPSGILRSLDGGEHWQSAGWPTKEVQPTAVALSRDGTQLVASTAGGGVFRARIDLKTGALDWTTTDALQTVVVKPRLLVGAADPMTLYASAFPGGTYKSTDGGSSWTEQNFGMANTTPLDPYRQGGYQIVGSPQANVLYLGLHGKGIYRSRDSAGTWWQANGVNGTLRDKPITAVVVDGANLGTVVVATERGVYRSTNSGQNWEPLNAGLDTLDIRSLTLAGDGTLYAGTAGYGVFRLAPGAPQWTRLGSLDVSTRERRIIRFDPANDETLLIGADPGGFWKSEDAGQSWREVNWGLRRDGAFALAFHPTEPSVVIAGTRDGIVRSSDAGETWSAVGDDLAAGYWIYDIAFDPRTPGVVYACGRLADGGDPLSAPTGVVIKSVDGGAHWAPITAELKLDQVFSRVLVDAFDSRIVYLWGAKHGVAVSRDAGLSWNPWRDGLPGVMPPVDGIADASIRPLALSANGRHLLLIVPGAGVFRRTALGAITLGD